MLLLNDNARHSAYKTKANSSEECFPVSECTEPQASQYKGLLFFPNFSSKQGGRNAAVVVVVVKMLVGRRPATPWPCVSAGSGTQPGASRWCQRRLLGLRVTVLVANMNHERPCGATIPNTTPRLIPPQTRATSVMQMLWALNELVPA